MLTRNVILLFSLFVLMVQGDLDSNDAGIQAMSTDKDSTSDEAPTESMNAISPEHLDEHLYYGGGPSDTRSSSSETADAQAANQVTAPEPATAAANSVEEQDEDESSDSDEGGKKKFRSRSAKPQQNPAHIHMDIASIQSPSLPVLSPALPPQPIMPQPKTQLRNRASKRRSRTNRRQI